MVSALRRGLAGLLALAYLLVATPAGAIGAWEYNGSSWVAQKPLNGATATNTYSVLQKGWAYDGSTWNPVYVAFTPSTSNCGSSSGSLFIPNGASQMVITLSGPGGGGGVGSGATPGGHGGNGGGETQTIALTSADWGASINYTFVFGGAGHTRTSVGNGSPAVASATMSGSVAAGSYSLTATTGNAGLQNGQNGLPGTGSGTGTPTTGGGSAGGLGGLLTFSDGQPGADSTCSASFT